MEKSQYQYRCLHEIVEAHASDAPDAVALVFGDRQLTYGELNRRANRLAHYLISSGVTPESRVGISLDRSIELVTSMVAVMKSGAAYISLDRSFPRERLAYMCADAGLSSLISVSNLLSELPDTGVRTICLDSDRRQIERCCSSNPEAAVSVDHIAHVIYTSGSRGKPKGVQVTHRSALGFASGVPYLEVGRSHTFLQWSSVSWDAISLEMWLAFLAGARCVLFPGVTPIPYEMRRVIETHQVSVAWLSASLLNVMIETEVEALSRLQILLTGSEIVSLAHVRRALPHLPQTLVVNGYGPSECGVISTAYAVNQNLPEGILSIPIGRPIGDREVYLLDSHLCQVPVDGTGTIYIGGPGVGRGYLNQPDLTAERFVPDSFSQVYGARLYRTGDLAREIGDENLEFIGRVDNQVKIRGHRIEPEEIQNTLEQHEEVRQAVVAASEDQAGNKRLVAYVLRHSPSLIESAASGQVELWPSGEGYLAQKDLPNYLMANEQARLEAYHAAIRETARDEVVLDLSPEPTVILAQMCVEAGARCVYAIKSEEDVFQKVKALVASLGLEDRIMVMHGDVSRMRLPEQAGVCVFTLGSIGGSEGMGSILNGAQWLLKPGATVIPRRSVTRIAAGRLPQTIHAHPRFVQASRQYVDRIFKKAGFPFDLRVAIGNLPFDHVMSDHAVFEDLEFSGPVPEEEIHSIRLTIQQKGSIDGFLLWVNLLTSDDRVVDAMEMRHPWSPVFFPVFYPGVEVEPGDVIEAVCSRRPCIENRRNPDYQIDFRIVRAHGTSRFARYRSPSFERSFQSSPFYQRIFDGEEAAGLPDRTASSFVSQLRSIAAERLPDYMLPSAYILVDSFPRLPNGKLDREALPAPEFRGAAHSEPRTPYEEAVTTIFAEVLGLQRVGIHDHFFELGGQSLLVIQVLSILRAAFQVDLSPRTFYEQPTAAHLAEAIQVTIATRDQIEATVSSKK
jgi:amino acid adenylation domain-containing protein